eukprot:CAMPEP_0183329616 /NCGR_PEP_ID=MMETSP0160_2-20130417/84884_1 /TAXON_ID=2839 ORGANISM="Odontella Sinensis, Strain Grunow 1884" /NCGR_SAMPLE_ID=MMETSP0160_2 /ASSEMBLY_ACC=CAM_ASM_000250 /LENGTH=450 /DNA_ID=CAMNT_0025497807 /DNA_START=41 /DNA_END=1390 /DNA_ORIENTATION=-
MSEDQSTGTTPGPGLEPGSVPAGSSPSVNAAVATTEGEADGAAVAATESEVAARLLGLAKAASEAASIARAKENQSAKEKSVVQQERVGGGMAAQKHAGIARAAAKAGMNRMAACSKTNCTKEPSSEISREQFRLAASIAAAQAKMQKFKGLPEDSRGWLHSFIRSYHWNEAYARCSTHPEELQRYDGYNITALHLVCRIGGAPSYLVERVVSSWPKAAEIQDTKRGNTPLHLQCMNSQRSSYEVSCLIKNCPKAASMLNKEGRSPLHVACVSNAMSPVLKQLVEADPSMLLQKDNSGATPLMLTWKAYSSSIQGMATLDAILRRGMRETSDGHFGRFWYKMTFLLGETFAYQHNYQSRGCTVHAILATDACSFDTNLLSLALKLNPDWAQQKDPNGNSPLHLAAAMAPPKAIKVMVEAGPRTDLESAASEPNCFGELPLFLAIKSNKKW